MKKLFPFIIFIVATIGAVAQSPVSSSTKRIGYTIYDKYGDKTSDYYTGEGKKYFDNGTIYNGKLKDGLPEGYGTIKWISGNQYEGFWKQGSPNGKGTYRYASGDMYSGDYVYGERTGYGMYKWANGDTYYGNFLDGNFEGYGTYYYSNGAKYVGYWSKDKRNGEGTCYYADGTKTTGYWKDDSFVGGSNYGSTTTTTSSSQSAYSASNDDDYADEDDITYYVAQVSTNLNLREGPSADSRILAQIPKGYYVFLSDADKWESFRLVLYVDKGISGYVSNYYLTNYKKIDVDSSGSLQKEAHTYASTSSVKLNNDCYKTATISIGTKKYTIAPYSSITATGITAGKYKIIASAPGVIPYVGFDTIEAGYIYSWSFYITPKLK